MSSLLKSMCISWPWWYEINGVWTSSATQLPDDMIVMLYTGSMEDDVQVQLLAEPAPGPE
jgi:hypothetical protein